MKIIHNLQSVDNPSAGPTNSVGHLSGHLAKRGHQVTVMTLGTQPASWPHASTLEVYDGLWSRLGLAPPRALAAFRRHGREAAILHGHGLWRLPNLFPLLLDRNAAARVVWSPRGMLSPWAWNHKARLKRPFWEMLQRPALERVDCFHATAENELEDVRRLRFRQPVAVIPNGVDLPEIADVPKVGRRVAFLSRIHEKKGVHLLLSAWRAVQDEFPTWELHIAGKIADDYGRNMLALAERLGANRVYFRGQLLGEEKRQLLAGSSLFVLPTFSENFGIAVAEAMAHGTPVLTTDETPWTDLAQRGCGWCIRPEEAALTETLRGALGLPLERLDAMGECARRWMDREYSWESVALMMERLYLWLAEGGARPDFVHG